MKRIIFRYFYLFAIGLGVAGYVAINWLNSENTATLFTALIVGIASFCYFVQQQRLAEIRLFKELFTEFNARYDTINGALSAIAASDELSPASRQLIVDYFNLCAEEYLFYREKYILPEVWGAWCR